MWCGVVETLRGALLRVHAFVVRLARVGGTLAWFVVVPWAEPGREAAMTEPGVERVRRNVAPPRSVTWRRVHSCPIAVGLSFPN